MVTEVPDHAKINASMIFLVRAYRTCYVEMDVDYLPPPRASREEWNTYNYMNAKQKQMRSEKTREMENNKPRGRRSNRLLWE